MDPWSEAVLEQNRCWLMAYLLGATGERAAAEDLVQEVFHIAYEKRAQFEPGTNFGGWLRGIARNCLRRFFERRGRQPVLVGDAMAALDEAAGRAQERLADPDWVTRRHSALQQCLARLGGRARRMLELKYGEGWQSRHIARTLRMTVSAVNVTVFRARAALASCVKKSLAADA